MDNMMEAIKTLKEGCAEKPMCRGCSIGFLCDDIFKDDPVCWEIPTEEETKDGVEEEETSVVVVQERLKTLSDFIDYLTNQTGCEDCPLEKECQRAFSRNQTSARCQNHILAWLQDQPLL